MYQKFDYWHKSFRKRKIRRYIYKQGNLRLRQLIKAGIKFKQFYYSYERVMGISPYFKEE